MGVGSGVDPGVFVTVGVGVLVVVTVGVGVGVFVGGGVDAGVLLGNGVGVTVLVGVGDGDGGSNDNCDEFGSAIPSALSINENVNPLTSDEFAPDNL